MEPKIFVGICTYEGKNYILERFVERVKSFTYPNLEILFIDNSETDDYMNKIKSLGMNCIKSKWDERSKIRLTNAQNLMRKKFLESDCTHIFILEQDLIPPKDIIEQLLSHDKEVVGGWYYITNHPRPCLSREWTLVDMKFFPQIPVMTDMAKERLMKCFLGSFGCSLIKRKVIEEIKFKSYVGFVHHADTWFYFDCEKKGFEVWTDTDLLIPHFQDYKWDKILDRDKEIEKEKMKLKLEELE
ncbi:MAG: glycosyltransferase family 2 protein [Candidatus Thorarchaeota archaeon]